MNRVFQLQRKLLALIGRQDPNAQRDEPSTLSVCTCLLRARGVAARPRARG